MPASISRNGLQQLLDATPFNRFYRFRVDSAGRGSCILRTPYRREFARPDGIIAGIIFIAAADVAMWLAIATRIGTHERAVTVEMKTNFLRGARKQGFQCRARVMKLGRQLVYGTAECYAPGRGVLSHHTLTYMRLPGEQIQT
ncbi:MAG TPA: PaaI family thioesterase [Candidatus Binatia bacterium]|nr:PaaI family thioesterase [Candidatus Binatia bacterium]